MQRSQLDRSSVRRSGSSGASPLVPPGQATWPLGTARYYAVDYDGGSDSNIGYSDVSAADAGTKALKTWHRLREILPINGAGRIVRILVKPRAAKAPYLNPNGSAADVDLRGLYEYSTFSEVRATTDFSDTTAEQILCGAVQAAAGPGVGGTWSVGAYATRVITPAAGVFPAQATIGGKRVRFLGNVTPAIANACATIMRITGAGDLVISGDLNGGSPAAGDEFVIEEAACVFSQFISSGNPGATENGSPGFSIAGFRFTATSQQISAYVMRFAFCEFAGSLTVTGHPGGLSFTRFYRRVLGASIFVGGNRFESTSFFSSIVGAFTLQHTYLTGNVSFSTPGVVQASIGGGCYFGGTVTAIGVGRGVIGGSGFGAGFILGRVNSSTIERAYFSRTVSVNSSSCYFWGATFGGLGASACITLFDDGQNLGLDDIQSDGGNTGVFVLAGATVRNTRISVGRITAFTSPTTGGDFSLPNSVVVTIAQLAQMDFRDDENNCLIGTGKVCMGSAVLCTNGSGGTLPIGSVVRVIADSSVTSAQANNAANATSVHGVTANAAANGAGVMVVTAGHCLTRFAADPAVPNVAYLDVGTAGQAQVAIPPVAATNQKLRLGTVVDPLGGGTGLAIVGLRPEIVPVLADGAA